MSDPSGRPLFLTSQLGYDCTAGLVNYLDKPVDYDANVVKVHKNILLKDAGAVPFLKTNVPQTLMAFHCSNPIFGVTLHPQNPHRTPGGSSGGEGALIASGGSPLGIGSDIGGSGRIPAHFCGIYSLKPTTNRISVKTTRESLEGVQGIYATLTPFARDVETLVLFMRTLLTDRMFAMDPEVVPIPFNDAIFLSRQHLKIGFYTDDGFVTPTPGCQRAVTIAKNVLETAGHKLIPFAIPDPWTAFRLSTKLFTADGRDKDIVDEKMMLNYRIANLPSACKKFLSAVSRGVTPRGALCIGETGCSGLELWKLMNSRKKYLALFISMWKEEQLDVVLAPGFSFPAPPHKYPEKLLPSCFVTVLYNLLNFPAGVVPVTTETEQDQAELESYRQDDLVFRLAKQATRGAIDMPLGVQVVGLPWQEEKVLRIMNELEGLLKRPMT
uniref:fatty acid amide hydrolase n=1 Tax=Strigamia maritima TaxID=126957 RepID=T1J1L1_STRMM